MKAIFFTGRGQLNYCRVCCSASKGFSTPVGYVFNVKGFNKGCRECMKWSEGNIFYGKGSIELM